MNRINIDHLTEAELIDLNHRIVQRLRLMSQVHAPKAMLEFRIGDRVTFEPEGGTPVLGILTRYNKKSVTVITDDGHRWNVSPRFLRLAESTLRAAKNTTRRPREHCDSVQAEMNAWPSSARWRSRRMSEFDLQNVSYPLEIVCMNHAY